MKRIVCLVLCCLFLVASCAHNKRTIVRVKGGIVKVPLFQGLVPIEGKDVEVIIIREINYLTKDKEIPKLSEVVIKEKGKDDSKNDEISVKK